MKTAWRGDRHVRHEASREADQGVARFGFSQGEFAKMLGVSQSQLSKYERRVVAPPANVLIRIKEQFQVSIDWLLTGDPESGRRLYRRR